MKAAILNDDQTIKNIIMVSPDYLENNQCYFVSSRSTLIKGDTYDSTRAIITDLPQEIEEYNKNNPEAAPLAKIVLSVEDETVVMSGNTIVAPIANGSTLAVIKGEVPVSDGPIILPLKNEDGWVSYKSITVKDGKFDLTISMPSGKYVISETLLQKHVSTHNLTIDPTEIIVTM